jgi:GT2 family glycosyltransferase
MRTAAVILNWNGAGLTRAAAESVCEHVGAVYLVDNASHPADAAAVEELASELGATYLPLERNRGYAGGNNAGIRAAMNSGAEAILVLNNDVRVSDGAVEALVERLQAEGGLAACAPLVVSPDTGDLFHSHCDLNLVTGDFGWRDFGRALHEVPEGPRQTGYVSGEAVLMRAEAVRQCGGFDERFFLTFEDTEWSARVRRAGWMLETCPEAVVVHHHKATMGDGISAFYMSRNYPLFLHLAIGVPWPVALLRGAGFAGRIVLASARRRNWQGVRGAVRGCKASISFLAQHRAL